MPEHEEQGDSDYSSNIDDAENTSLGSAIMDESAVDGSHCKECKEGDDSNQYTPVSRGVEEHSVVQKGDWALVVLMSSNSRLINIRGSGIVNLGKFGSFSESSIIGKAYDLTYEVVTPDDLRPLLERNSLNVGG